MLYNVGKGKLSGKEARLSPFVWIGVAVVMAIVEALSLGFVTIWFVLGAVVALIAQVLGFGIAVQIVVFLVVSIAFLLLVRPYALKHRNRGAAAEPSMVGKTARVIVPISADGTHGRVETADGVCWTAISAAGEDIPQGTQVRIVKVESIKLFVERI